MPNDEEVDTVRLAELRARFSSHVLDGIPRLRRLGYKPFELLEMIESEGGALGAAKSLLADPRGTSYGFERLRELGQLEASVEFAVCLPWFTELFTEAEVGEARSRLLSQTFPLDSKLAARAAQAPEWTLDL